jgi:hypothetical protein
MEVSALQQQHPGALALAAGNGQDSPLLLALTLVVRLYLAAVMLVGVVIGGAVLGPLLAIRWLNRKLLRALEPA